MFAKRRWKWTLFCTTLGGLSFFFFKILSISNIVFILATIHFLYTKLGSFCNMEYYFNQLESPQALGRIKSNAVLFFS